MTRKPKSLLTDTQDPFEVFLGDGYGAMVRGALQMLALVPEDNLREAIRKISHAETMGPMLDPTAWLGGTLFNNARGWRAILESPLELRQALEKERLRSVVAVTP